MPKYIQIDPSALAHQNDHAVFQSVAEHVTSLVGDAWGHSAVELLEGVPEATVSAWRLWWFAAGVGGNGLPDYFLNHCLSVSEAQAYYAALKSVGATELVEMFESCIPFALGIEAEIAYLPGAEWFRKFSQTGRWESMEEMEGPSIDLAGDPLSSLVTSHIRASSHLV